MINLTGNISHSTPLTRLSFLFFSFLSFHRSKRHRVQRIGRSTASACKERTRSSKRTRENKVISAPIFENSSPFLSRLLALTLLCIYRTYQIKLQQKTELEKTFQKIAQGLSPASSVITSSLSASPVSNGRNGVGTAKKSNISDDVQLQIHQMILNLLLNNPALASSIASLIRTQQQPTTSDAMEKSVGVELESVLEQLVQEENKTKH